MLVFSPGAPELVVCRRLSRTLFCLPFYGAVLVLRALLTLPVILCPGLSQVQTYIVVTHVGRDVIVLTRRSVEAACPLTCSEAAQLVHVWTELVYRVLLGVTGLCARSFIKEAFV